MEIPYAIWFRKTPDYYRLRTFGCAVSAYTDKPERRKMDVKAREAVFVGYNREKRGYRLLDSHSGKAFYCQTAIFYEEKSGRLMVGQLDTVDTASTKQYLQVDDVTMERIPVMLDEEPARDSSVARTGGADEDEVQHPAVGAQNEVQQKGNYSGQGKKRG
ncbi:putative integrase catalytic domain-containing protein [Phytophthora infestans]|uniref:Putative integrase catalytic domain-containing protein n=1 Tax=Phytophthora infestans TaxID=4787 RepID=A0A8S9UZU9_PHYIN|nr:putative integrase catalytic domain-containing protein [Phytophthora infestans]KAF4146230.1 putative integrase catalytic domain-containing protein [Phytophthora infestans]